MPNYYIRNMETGKLELHFDKADYMALTDDQKAKIRSNFLFSRGTGAWISRCKFPNLYRPECVAKELGLEDAGREGETLTFEQQMDRKMEKAERRAERMEYKADKAHEKGVALQKPINDMHGDIAFFTQPNINTSSGRAFTNRRNKMFDAWERGFAEFSKSEYYAECAAKARQTASGKDQKDKAFCQRRIDEAEASIRGLKRSIATYEGYKKAIENGEIPKDKYGWELKALTAERIDAELDRWYEIMENEIGKSVYYHECIENQGGISFSKENLNKGDLVQINRYRHSVVRIVRFGAKNVTFEFTDAHMKYADGSPMQGKCAYAEIEKVVKSA